MVGREIKVSRFEKKRNWYELPILITIAGSILIIVGQFATTLLPIMVGQEDSSDFYITVKPISIEVNRLYEKEALSIGHEIRESPSGDYYTFNVFDLPYSNIPQFSQVDVEVHNLHEIIRRYVHPIFLKVVDCPQNIIAEFDNPQGIPSFRTNMTIKILSLNPNDTIINYPLTIQGIGGNGKTRNCTFFVIYKSYKYYLKEGYTQFLLRNYPFSIANYDKAIDINPKCAEAWANKSEAYQILGEYNNALQCLNKSIEIDRNYTNAYIWKGSILSGLRMYNEALICLDKAIYIDSKCSQAWGKKDSS